MKILTICPSIYPQKMATMMDSFLVTRSKNTQIIVNYEIKPITTIFNEVFEKNPNYDFYFMSNDDIIFKTPLWDIELAKKGKISHGTDKVDIGENGNFMMIDGDIARAVGWLQMPSLNKYGGDTVWKFIGKQLDILEYVPEVIIQHNWAGANKEENERDMNKWAEWLPWAFKDIYKIRKVLNVK